MRLPGEKCRGLRFGVFEADLELHELRKHGLHIKLTGQPFQVLTLLLERPGEVVTRDELRNTLWPDEPCGDHDQRVNKIINKIREALCDSADAPRFLETVPRIGYRFIIPVKRLGELGPGREPEPVANEILLPPALPATPSLQPHAVAINPSRNVWPILSTITILVTISLGFIYYLSSTTHQTPIIAESTPITTYVGSELYPSFSPDGKHVVFSWDNDSKSNFHIYTSAVGDGGAHQLTDSSKSDYGPVWSPDGREIAFLRASSGQQVEVWVVQPDGKGSRKIKGIGRANAEHPLTWSEDSAWLVFAAPIRTAGPTALFLLSTKTGDQRQITFISAQSGGDLNPAISPDGQTLAFARATSASWRDIYIVRLSKDRLAIGEPLRLTDLRRVIDTIAWTPDSRSLVFSAATTPAGARHLGRIDVTSSAPNHDFTEMGIEGDHPAISRIGAKLAYVRKNIEQSSIWRLELQTATAVPKRSRMVSSTRRDFSADISPDGKRLVFSSVRSGPSEIWLSGTDGSSLKRITSLGASTPRWSPDGQRIAFESKVRGQPDIYVYTLATNAIERLTSEGASNLRPSWSRDGKFI